MAARASLVLLSVALAALGPARARADEPPHPRAHGPSAAEDDEHTLVLGLGGAGEVDLRERAFRPGAHAFVEWTAIRDWLELELGASLLAHGGAVEVPVELLLKKPFALGHNAEVMLGIGPEIVYAASSGARKAATSLGLAVDLDFMFWPWRRIGLWVEPGYDVVFHGGASHGLGVTAGVLVGW
jgi:hypothetical protein